MRIRPLVTLTCVMVAVFAGLYAVHPWLLARYWEFRLQDSSERHGARQLDLARAMGDSAIHILARTVGDHRPELATKARRELLAEVDAARLEPTTTAAGRLIRVAQLLAAESPNWDVTARSENATLATRILSVAGEHFSQADRDILVAHCETILRAAHRREAAPTSVTTSAQSATPLTSPAANLPPAPQPIATSEFDAPLAQYPGGGLPIDRAGPPVPSLTKPETPQAAPVPEPGPSLTVANEPTRLTDEDAPEPLPLTAASSQLREMPRFQQERGHRVSVGATAAAIAIREASHVAGRPTSPVIEMAQRLHSPSDVTRASARAELRAIGYSESHVDLLHSVTDPDGIKRAAAARALPVMRGMNAQPWLLWLSFDDEEEVRHAAISVLATSYDPALADRMRVAANTDPAPRVRRLAEIYLTNLAAQAR